MNIMSYPKKLRLRYQEKKIATVERKLDGVEVTQYINYTASTTIAVSVPSYANFYSAMNAGKFVNDVLEHYGVH